MPVKMRTYSHLHVHEGHHPTLLTYEPTAVILALDRLIEAAVAAPALLDVSAFSMDLVDVARQAFMNLGIPLYENVSGALRAR